MLQKDEGLVLRVARSGETSLLVTFLGRRMGKIRLIAKGVLGPKHRPSVALETASHLEVMFYYKPDRTLYHLKESALLSPAVPRRESLAHMATTLAAMELLDQVCYAGSADEIVVDVAVEFIRANTGLDPLSLFLCFELRLLDALGAMPQLECCALCGARPRRGVYLPHEAVAYCGEHAAAAPEAIALPEAVIEAAARGLSEPFDVLKNDEMARGTRKNLGKVVHWTYTYHVQGYSLPKSLSLM